MSHRPRPARSGASRPGSKNAGHGPKRRADNARRAAGSLYGLRPPRLPAARIPSTETNGMEQEATVVHSRNHAISGTSPGPKFNRQGGSKFGRRDTPGWLRDRADPVLTWVQDDVDQGCEPLRKCCAGAASLCKRAGSRGWGSSCASGCPGGRVPHTGSRCSGNERRPRLQAAMVSK